jgi:hypothetical protein
LGHLPSNSPGGRLPPPRVLSRHRAATRFSDVFFAGTGFEQGKFGVHFIEQRSGHSCIPLGLINLER